jgi:hypothetical protein
VTLIKLSMLNEILHEVQDGIDAFVMWRKFKMVMMHLSCGGTYGRWNL